MFDSVAYQLDVDKKLLPLFPKGNGRELLRKYMEFLRIEKFQEFSIKAGGWFKVKKNGFDKKLCETDVIYHLLGRFIVGSVLSEYIDRIILDCDTKHLIGQDEADILRYRKEITEELLSVFNVKPIFIPFQSSDNKGWHIYILLDNFYKKDELQEFVLNFFRSKKSSLKLKHVDLFPSNSNLKYPLGENSAILDPETLLYKFAHEADLVYKKDGKVFSKDKVLLREYKKGQFRKRLVIKDLEQEINFAHEFFTNPANRVSLDDLIPNKEQYRSPEVNIGGTISNPFPYGIFLPISKTKSRTKSKTKAFTPSRPHRPNASKTSQDAIPAPTGDNRLFYLASYEGILRGQDWKDFIKGHIDGIKYEGTRVNVGLKMGWHFYEQVTHRDLDKTLQLFKDWLYNNSHVSKDLRRDFDKTAQHMLKHLPQYLLNRTPKYKPKSFTVSSFKHPCITTTTNRYRSKHGRNWKSYLKNDYSHPYTDLFLQIPNNSKLLQNCHLLIALCLSLRSKLITVPSTELKTTFNGISYKTILNTLINLGFIKLHEAGDPGITYSIYEVTCYEKYLRPYKSISRPTKIINTDVTSLVNTSSSPRTTRTDQVINPQYSYYGIINSNQSTNSTSDSKKIDKPPW